MRERRIRQMEITAGIHLLQATKGSYVYLVLGDEPILIDTSFPGRATAILTELEKFGLRSTDIAHILLTHQDGDHIGCVQRMASLSNAETCGRHCWVEQKKRLLRGFCQMKRHQYEYAARNGSLGRSAAIW